MAKVAVYKVMWRNKKNKAESTSYVVAPFRWVDPKFIDPKWLKDNPDYVAPASHQHDGGELLTILAKNLGLIYSDVEFVSRDIVVAEAVDGQDAPTSATKPLAPPASPVVAPRASAAPARTTFGSTSSLGGSTTKDPDKP